VRLEGNEREQKEKCITITVRLNINTKGERHTGTFNQGMGHKYKKSVDSG
jgi:hypothetical protein